jgi:hypothetical protein
MGSEAELLWGVLFGAVGLGFFVYGEHAKLGEAVKQPF